MSLTAVLLVLAGVAAEPSAAELDRTVADFTRACDADSPLGCLSLASLAEARPSLGMPYPTQVALLAKACRSGEIEACVEQGRRLSVGPPIDRDWDRIGKLWIDACEQGVAEGCRQLAAAYARRELEPSDSPLLADVQVEAAIEALMFDVDRARVLARPLLGSHDQAERARLVLACADVIEDRWEQAHLKIDDRVGIDPAYAMLSRLLEEREAYSHVPWVDAYVRSWAKLGQPDMRRSLLFVGRAPPPRRRIELDGASQMLRLLAAIDRWGPWLGADRAPPEPLPVDVVDVALATPKDDPVPEQLLALLILQSPQVPLPFQQRAQAMAIDIVESLAQADPDNLLAAFRAFVTEGDPTGPYDRDAIDTIERLSSLEDTDAEKALAYEMYSAQLVPADPEGGFERARAAVRLATAPAWWPVLQQRVEATRGHSSDADWSRLTKAIRRLTDLFRTPSPENDRWVPGAADALLDWPIPDLRDEVMAGLAQDERGFRALLDTALHEASKPKS